MYQVHEDQQEAPINAEQRKDALSLRVLDVAMTVASAGDGRSFTVEDLRARLTTLQPGQINDCLKTLKYLGRVYGRGGGHYEITEAYPKARPVGVVRGTDSWFVITVGRHQLIVTEEEYRRINDFGGGFAARTYMDSEVRELRADILRLNRRQDMADRRDRDRRRKDGKDERPSPAGV